MHLFVLGPPHFLTGTFGDEPTQNRGTRKAGGVTVTVGFLANETETGSLKRAQTKLYNIYIYIERFVSK